MDGSELKVSDYTPISLSDFDTSFEQLKNGLISISLDVSDDDAVIFEKLIRRLELIPEGIVT